MTELSAIIIVDTSYRQYDKISTYINKPVTSAHEFTRW